MDTNIEILGDQEETLGTAEDSQKLRPSKCEAYGRNRVRRSASDIIHFVGFGHEKRYTVDPSWLIQLGG